MHASSYENMQKCIDRYLGDVFFQAAGRTVIDIGSNDVNGSYRRLFQGLQGEYRGVDLAPGPGVDVVLDDPYVLPFPDGCADVVVSGQMLEHCEFFWKAFQEMVRILSPTGYIFLIAPSAGPIHRHPVDCYRYYPDGFAALAKHAGCDVVTIWRDERGPWCDLVGVFSKDPAAIGKPPYPPRFATHNQRPLKTDPKAEIRQGRIPRGRMLAKIHQHAAPRRYLEIGVSHGQSLALAKCPSIAIDPEPVADVPMGHHIRLFQTTSDIFFEEHAATVLQEPPDLAFIDGMHLFEFALRDFMNVERYAHAGTIVVIDDIFPNHPRQAGRQRRTVMWSGDVWKLAHCLLWLRPDLHLIPLDVSPAGLLIILGLHPENRVLWEQYNNIVFQYEKPEFNRPPQAVLQRKNAFDPTSPALVKLIETVRAVRDRDKARRLIALAVREFKTLVAK